MRAEEAFETWAPAGGPWSPWVKPILFASESDWSGGEALLGGVPELPWLEEAARSKGYREIERARVSADPATCFVVDLPGAGAVPYGVALARRGWRPIPLYSAVPGGAGPVPAPASALGPVSPLALSDSSAVVDVMPIVRAMRGATAALAALGLAPDGPPAFLLDADRRFGRGMPMPGRFDNRSMSLPTDFPSAVFLKSRGVRRAVLVQARAGEPEEDLAHTLRAWQLGGVEILVKSVADDASPAPIEVATPSQFRSIFHRALATMGLRRSPLGGFGAVIPIPSAG